MRILHVIPSFFPNTGWGGPIWSTKAICDGVAALPGVTLRVLTTDMAPAGQPRKRASLPYHVDYTRGATGLLARLPAAMGWADVVHLTGTYSFPTLPVLAMARVMHRPVVWSLRGAVQATQDWPDSPNKHAKHAFEAAANALMPQGCVLHVTAEAEAHASAPNLPRGLPCIIPNSVPLPADPAPLIRGKGLRLMFLSRLHAKKGLTTLLAAMSHLPQNVTLDIYGTGPEAERLAQVAARSPRIRLHGHVEGAAKAEAFAKADIFVLPSASENFGIVVAEALAHGRPVVTTTATPWQGVIAQGCGALIPPGDSSALARAITDLAAQDLAEMGQRGRRWIAQSYAPEAMTQRFAALYAGLCPPEMLVA
ncbi:glycosyltransferase family 4 protein [Alphaproteobacteria bacterium KMM 3653]|uniref:Glycosyltransferase family 4 protein n=1 Tax=Harenicola maris TaxID=2841044 RepID=A0AAP2G8B8_9RHOB|nr:glycosyltransferase family 4 protein [Harenicola maris]